MAALTDLSDLVNRMTGGNSGTPEYPVVWIDGRIGAAAATSPVAGRMIDLWRYNKSPGCNGAVPPSSAFAPTNGTQGALPFTNSAGGRVKKLLSVWFAGNAIGVGILYDRLLHISGLSGTVTTAQTVGGTMTRYATNATCLGNQIWVAINTQIGATGTTITASYTNQAGTSGRTTQATAIGATGLREAERLIPLPLQDGDTGVEAVASVTLAATTGTAGDFGVVVARPLGISGSPSIGGATAMDCITGLPGIRELENSACLSVAWLANTTTIPAGFIGLSLIEK